ncbi:MAG TPA: glycosyltransferase family 29 protein [Nitrospiraceae bacterium]|nr:glycosyltransferase family 29 protein [Nitrospiraceae bacterium]
MRVAVVGNAPLETDYSAQIDACDIVIRFNAAPEYGRNAGLKTTILFLMNSGKTTQQRLKDPAFLDSALIGGAERVYLPYHPEIIRKYHPKPNLLSRLKGRRADLTWEIIRKLGERQKRVTILPPQFYEESCAELGIPEADRTHVFPSTGFLGLRYASVSYPAPSWQIKACAFQWEGWKRHNWQEESRWFKDRLPDANFERH